MILTPPSDKLVKKAFKHMTSDEKLELCCLSFNGIIINDGADYIILMGRHSMNRMNLFKYRMIKKYKV